MFQKLVNHNKDIWRLVEKGYAAAFDSNCLIIRDIPYLDKEKRLQIGAIVTKLVFVNNEQVCQDNHQIFFAGSSPHSIDGKLIPNLGDRNATFALSTACNDFAVQRSFSNKPRTGKFNDFFEKIESYVTIISGPAMELYGVDPYTFRQVENEEYESVFKFHDTLTSRAEITDLSAKFKDDVVAIIGLGGTGSYVLDFLVKTPVREIRGFDFDPYHVHNAFRSPGQMKKDELGKSKADVYRLRYKNFRSGLTCKSESVDASSSEDFDGVTFAFVCVDKGSSRSDIFDLLISKGIPFIDVGMGLDRKNGMLNGMLRATYYSTNEAQTVQEQRLVPLEDNPENLYRANVQTNELNALNACLAVIRFKQLRGFYLEEIPYYHMCFRIGNFKIIGEASIEN